MISTLVFIGAGNVATNMAKAFRKTDYKVLQVYSRTIGHAQMLANEIHAEFTNNPAKIRTDADGIFFGKR